MRQLITFFALPVHERRLMLAALPIVLISRVGLCMLPLTLLQRLLNWFADTTWEAQAHRDYADRAARAVRRASRLIPGSTSMVQALATTTLLRRRGLVGRLQIGVRRQDDGNVSPHASVMLGGRLIIGEPAASVIHLSCR